MLQNEGYIIQVGTNLQGADTNIEAKIVYANELVNKE